MQASLVTVSKKDDDVDKKVKKIRKHIKMICKFVDSSTDKENITSFNNQIKELELKLIGIISNEIATTTKRQNFYF